MLDIYFCMVLFFLNLFVIGEMFWYFLGGILFIGCKILFYWNKNGLVDGVWVFFECEKWVFFYELLLICVVKLFEYGVGVIVGV